MTEQMDDLPVEGDDPLTAQLKATRRSVARHHRRTTRIIAVVVVGLILDTAATGFAFAAFVREADNRRHNEQVICERLNTANQKHIDLWVNLIASNPPLPPGPDATAEEIRVYEEGQVTTVQFVKDLHEQFDPVKC